MKSMGRCLVAAMTAGHNALRGSGPGQKHAFLDAVALMGCSDRRIDRRCITCCSPSQPLRHAGDVGASGTQVGVQGWSTTENGVEGWAYQGTGLFGISAFSRGVYGGSTSGFGVYGSSENNAGVYGYSVDGIGVLGRINSPADYAGVFEGQVRRLSCVRHTRRRLPRAICAPQEQQL